MNSKYPNNFFWKGLILIFFSNSKGCIKRKTTKFKNMSFVFAYFVQFGRIELRKRQRKRTDLALFLLVSDSESSEIRMCERVFRFEIKKDFLMSFNFIFRLIIKNETSYLQVRQDLPCTILIQMFRLLCAIGFASHRQQTDRHADRVKLSLYI